MERIYFGFVLSTNTEILKEGGRVELNKWKYPIVQINEYMLKSMKNETAFVAYREENNIFTTFCFDDMKYEYKEIYDYDLSEEFILDRDENVESSDEKLQQLIGLDLVKKQIDTILAADIVEKERKNVRKRAISLAKCK